MKKSIILLLISILCCSFAVPAFAAYTDSFETDAPIVYVVSADKDATVIYDKGADTKCDPGEIVKIVTGILVIENCTDFGASVTASNDAIRRIEQVRATTAGILVGEVMTVEELLHCLLVYNAGDAALVLSEYIAGSEEEFVLMMNDFAKKLGLKNTNFTNSVGYNEEGQYSTAADIAVMFNYCMENPQFSSIISTFLYEMPATNKYSQIRYLKNTNNLINSGIYDYYFEYVKGGKSGYTSSLNCNSVSVASKDGYNYICVVLDAENKDYDGDDVNENMSFVVSKQLYDWVFDNIKLREVANVSTYVCEVEVRLSSKYDYVSLVPSENVSALVPSGVDASSVYIEPIEELTPVDAPVKKGDFITKAYVKYAGEIVAEVDLVADFDVNRSIIKYIGSVLLKIISSPIFIILAVAAIIIVPSVFFVWYRNMMIKRRAQRRRAYHNNIRRD